MPVKFVTIRPFTRGSESYVYGDEIDVAGLDENTIASLFRNGWIAPYGGESSGGGGGTGSNGAFEALIGNGTDATYDIAHGLGTRAVGALFAWDTTTDPEEEMLPAWFIVDDNTVRATFPDPIDTDSVRIMVLVAGGGSSGGGSGGSGYLVHSEVLGDGTEDVFDITHGFNSQSIVVTQAWDVSEYPADEFFPAWQIIDDNTVRVTFPSVPDTDGARIILMAVDE